MEWNENSPLELCEGETVKQNDLLKLYYAMGADRSLSKMALHPDCTVCLKTLQIYSKECEWQARIRAQYILDSQHIQNELIELKTAILGEFASKLYMAIQNAQVEDSSISQLSTALKSLFDAFAVHFDAMPTKRVQTLDLSKLSFEDILQQYKEVEKTVK